MQAGQLLLGRYEVTALIGSGGFGKVYKARQRSTGQWVAAKVLDTEGVSDTRRLAEMHARFHREMELIARLRHPNIVSLIDSGLEGESRVMVMEFVDGEDLENRIHRKGPLDVAMTRRVFVQILDAVAEAHHQGVIHRDLKPGNIMLCGRENRPSVKVLDFGIARIAEPITESEARPLTREGTIPGTPSFLAPELVRNGLATHASDLYALGLILVECLSGKRVVEGESAVDTCVKQITEPLDIPRGVLEGPFARIVERSCAKEPEARYASADEMLDAVEKLSVEGGEPGFDEGFFRSRRARVQPASPGTNPVAARPKSQPGAEEGDSFQVLVSVEQLSPSLLEGLNQALGRGKLEHANAGVIQSDGSWLAGRELSRRQAQALRRQLMGMGLDAAVEAQDAPSDSEEPFVFEDFAGAQGKPDDVEVRHEAPVDVGEGWSGVDAQSSPAQARELAMLSWFGGEEHELPTIAVSNASLREASLQGAVVPEFEVEEASASSPPPSNPRPVPEQSPSVPPSSSPKPGSVVSVPRPSGTSPMMLANEASKSARPRPRASSQSLWDHDWARPVAFAGGGLVMALMLVWMIAGGPCSEEAPEQDGLRQRAISEPRPRSLAPEPVEELAPIEEELEEDVEDEVDAQSSTEQTARELFEEGKTLCVLQQWQRCQATMEAVIVLDPQHPEAYDWIIKAKAGFDKLELEKKVAPRSTPKEPKIIVITPNMQREPDVLSTP